MLPIQRHRDTHGEDFLFMSLFGEYIAERANKCIVEDNDGFATYFFIDKGVYIEDLYVKPDARHAGCASKYADQIANIAKEKGYTKMFGSVSLAANHSTSSLKVLFAYGFELDSANNNMIFVSKGI